MGDHALPGFEEGDPEDEDGRYGWASGG